MARFVDPKDARLRCESCIVDEGGRIVFPGTGSDKAPWRIYNQLIEGVPDDVLVRDYCLGTNWSYIEAECGSGIGYTASQGAKRLVRDDLRGRSLREVAELSKSWCFEEATLGIAALNAWYNRPALLEQFDIVYDEPVELPDGTIRKVDAFELWRPEITAKGDARVVVVGHFPHVDRIAEYARVTVLERACRDQIDTPDPACEYVMPEADYAFITGVTFINKTVTRLLELARDAKVIMVGPSVVMAPCMFGYGVTSLSGSVVADPEKAAFACKNGAGQFFGEALQMCSIDNPDA